MKFVVWMLNILACVIVLLALVAPRDYGELEIGILLRIPLEAIVFCLLAIVLPSRFRKVFAVAVGALAGLLLVFKAFDIGFDSVLTRPFNPVLDPVLLGNAMEFLESTYGNLTSIAMAFAAVVLIIAIISIVTLSFSRVATLVDKHPKLIRSAMTPLAVLWVVLALIGTTATVNTADLAKDKTVLVAKSLRDRHAFKTQSANDSFRNMPSERLLTKLRNKEVVFTFIESYGQSAIEDPGMSPEINAVLDGGMKRLEADGFSARSGLLTSPISGGGSWMAHATFFSGLWVNNQQRYDTVVASDRLAIPGAFKRSGWNTLAVVPGTTRAWPESHFYGFDEVYDVHRLDYKGSRLGWSTIPDQYALSKFESIKRSGASNRPLMTDITLTSSHTPWDSAPPVIDWDTVGDGLIFNTFPSAPRDRPSWANRTGARNDYRDTIAYSLSSVLSYVEQYGDDDLVLVFLGDHQPLQIVTGDDATRNVPISIVTRDHAVLEQINSWNWENGLKPSTNAPAWRMDEFRNRFLTAFSS